ncbi:MAG: hypothetical protein ACRD5M_11415 [Candidatus Acidiferrales bacterium]
MASISEARRAKLAEAARHSQPGVEKRDGGDQDREQQAGMRGSIAGRKIERKIGEREAKQRASRIIRNYLFRIFEKLGISSRVELVLYCLQQRKIAPADVEN